MQGALLEQLARSSQAARVPLEVLFEVTHRCNLPCVHCYLPDHLDKGELTFEEILGVFDQLADAGTVFLTLTGGEVLSRRDFCDLVDAAAQRGFAVKVLTNATLVTDEIAARWAAAGVLEVSVSVYGATPEVHDQVTGLPGSLARTMAGIERLRAAGLHVVMKTPVMVGNDAGARDLHALALRQNMPCNFDLVITPKNDGDPGPLRLALSRERMVGLMTDEAWRDVFLPEARAGEGPEPCNAGRSYCAIGPTGDVMPCIMMPKVAGNLRQRPFRELWLEDPFFAQLRAMTRDDLTACGTCDVRGACSRCPGIAMHRGQGGGGCDLSGREVARARVEARHRLRVIK